MSQTIFKIFTNKQLSYFFQIAIIINIIGLLSDIIVYRYFPDYNVLKLLCENLSNLSIFIVCLIIISQSLFIFIKNHLTLIHRYKLASLAIGITIGTFFMWILTTDNNMQESFIIHISKMSRTDSSNKAIIALLGIFAFLLYNLYHTLTKPDEINDKSIPKSIQSVVRLVIEEYILIFIFIFGIIHFTSMHTFSLKMVNETKEAILFNLSLLEILIPTAWIGAISYYIYTHYYLKNRHKND
jgi:hypothetical protein